MSLYIPHRNIELEGDFKQSVNSYVLIAGDTLFRESIGRTDLPMGNHDELLNSVKDKLFTLPHDTLVLSGHGPNTTISHEKEHNPFFV